MPALDAPVMSPGCPYAHAGVQNVSVVWCRAEDGGRQPALRDGFDIAVARAVAETRVLAELCLPFVRPEGLWVAAKGPSPDVSMCFCVCMCVCVGAWVWVWGSGGGMGLHRKAACAVPSATSACAMLAHTS